MLSNQNTIVLKPCNGFYEEFVLASEELGSVLPGAMLATKAVVDDGGNPVVQSDGISTAVLTSQVPVGGDIDTIEPFIVVENALLGKSINHKAFPGEVTPVYRPVSGDRFLARAVIGNYVQGDALYFVQTENGIYFTKDSTSTGAGSVVKAYVAESFVVSSTNAALKPPVFYDVVDDSTTERPSSVRLNGGVVNLLRVRFA